MKFRIVLEKRFESEVRQFADYLTKVKGEWSDFNTAAIEIDQALAGIAAKPDMHPYLHIVGAPYRACLYRYSLRQTYWIIYLTDDAAGIVRFLSFWHTSRDPLTLLSRR